MLTNVGSSRTDDGRSGTNKSAKELTRWDGKKTVPHPAAPGGRTSGSSDLNSDALTTELRLPSMVM